MRKVNYHTHTFRCKHAKDDDESYVLAAIEGGYEVLGFSDHVPWRYERPFSSLTRMDLCMLDDYVKSIRDLKEKYKDRIEILVGFECEYFPKYMDYLKEMIIDKDIDYIIFGNHFYNTDEDGAYYGRLCDKDEYMYRYLDGVYKGMATGLYSYLCHPDVFMRARKVFDDVARDVSEKICTYAKENDIVLEYNLEGMKNKDEGRDVFYPCDEFWKIASTHKNKVIIGVDAHESYALKTDKYYKEALKRIKELDLELVDEIKRRS